ncbi:MAG: GNAT family N-acetyltransferase [Cypionkella sp.]
MSPADFAQTMEATWPPFATHRSGPWTIREGAGGGKRVSAASAEGDWHDTDIALAEAAMQALGQDPLFVIWPWDEALDAALAAKGYELIDPVLGYAAPVSAFETPPRMTTFPHWPPMQIARDIWAEGHIGPGRLAVMERASGPKTVILSRSHDKPSGTAFVAINDKTALIHAIEVRPDMRRKGAGRHLLSAAAQWAAHNGADRLALAVTTANTAARTLYASLGMQVVGQYHYRTK